MNKLFINADWVDARDGSAYDLINPSTEELISKMAKAGPADAVLAIDAAAEAFKTWRQTTPYFARGDFKEGSGLFTRNIWRPSRLIWFWKPASPFRSQRRICRCCQSF